MTTRERGVAIISIDTELAWGEAHRRDGSGGGHDLDCEREVIGRILDVFARYEITATWAMVGHLFLDRCSPGADGRPHPEVTRPAYDWIDGDWLAIDPCTDRTRAPWWYGDDIVRRIMACPAPQEIGSHAFSHVIADDPGCSAGVLASELAASQAAAADHGLTLRSFVYPRNAIAHLDALTEHGVVAYRGGRPRVPFADRPSWQARALGLVDRARPLAGSAVRPERHPSGVWNVPQTYLFAPATSGAWLPPALWARRPIARLRQAARHKSVFHLWFHPYNVTATPDRALATLDRICREMARLRSQGRIDVLGMAQFADRLGPPLAAERSTSHG